MRASETSKAFRQQPRREADGPVAIDRDANDMLVISATTAGEQRAIRVSEYNASRLLGMLALMLGVRLNPTDAKAIKLGDEFKARI